VVNATWFFHHRTIPATFVFIPAGTLQSRLSFCLDSCRIRWVDSGGFPSSSCRCICLLPARTTQSKCSVAARYIDVGGKRYEDTLTLWHRQVPGRAPTALPGGLCYWAGPASAQAAGGGGAFDVDRLTVSAFDVLPLVAVLRRWRRYILVAFFDPCRVITWYYQMFEKIEEISGFEMSELCLLKPLKGKKVLFLPFRGLTKFFQVRCSLQVTLCDPYLSALSVRYFNKGAI